MTDVHILDLQGLPILAQLQYEEALLRADRRNWCLINHGSPPAIVMGISSQFSELIHQERLQDDPIPVIRRFSGGGTVVVDEDTLFITFIFNANDAAIPSFPEHIMRWTEKIYQPLFSAHPFSLQENDYVIGHKKFGGNAQSITKGRWLHHSSLLYNFKPEHMEYLHLPKKAPNYRQQRPHSEFLCCLHDYWPALPLLKEAFIARLQDLFQLIEIDREEIEKVISLPHRKATKVEFEAN